MSISTAAVGETSLPLPSITPTLPLQPESLDEEKRVSGSATPLSTKSDSEGSTSGDTWFAESIFGDSVFEDEKLAKFYEPPDNYESKHRFDPSLRWTKEEDARVVRKCDIRLFAFICLCFAALQLDRANISFALADDMLQDIGVSTNQYNTGMTIFYVSFLSAELPSQLISKWLGVDVWVPIQIMGWSIVAICQCRVHDVHTFYLTRALLGLLEGGFIPDIILFLSYSYTSAELAIRLSWFWVTLTLTNIIGSFLAAAILPMRGLNGWAGWQYLFLIEGCITLAIGLFAAVWLPPSPTQTKSWFRGKAGWFTDREEAIITMRVLRDDPTKSSMHNRQHISLKELWKSLCDYDHIPLYLLGLTTYIAAGTVGAYFTLILRSLGYSTFLTTMLQIPHYVLFMLNNLGLSFLSKRLKERTFVASLAAWWQFIFLIVLVAIPDSTNRWAKYAILTLFLAYPYCHPILVSWNSTNSGSVRTRSVSASLYNMTVQSGSIIASNIYRQEDRPYYHRGNRVLLGIVSANIVLFFFTKAYFILRNRSNARKWDALSPEEREHYLATTKDEGNRRINFKFVH